MPPAENAVHIAPVHGLLLHHRALIGRPEGLVVKAHLIPCGNVILLPLHQRPGRDVQQPQHLRPAAPQPHQGLEIALRRLHRVDPLPGPDKALPADLGEEGLATGAVFALHLLHTPVDQKKDDLGGQGQVVVQGVQDLQIVGGELFAQPPLHFIGQGREGGGRVAEGGGDILRPILRGRGLRGDVRGGRSGGQSGRGQAVLLQLVQRPLLPVLRPAQAVRRAPAQQVQVQQGSVAAVQLQKPVSRLVRHGDHAARHQQLGHPPPSLRILICSILPQNPPGVNRKSVRFPVRRTEAADFQREKAPAVPG